MPNSIRATIFALGFSTLSIGSAAHAVPVAFSVDAASPAVPGVSQSDVLAPGPVGGPPAVSAPATALGLPAGTTDEVDALSAFFVDEGGDGIPFVFSVDRGSVGAPGSAVASEAASGQAAGDVFFGPASQMGTGNSLFKNQDSLGLTPATASGTPTSPPIDDIDALEGPIFEDEVSIEFFSLASGNSAGVSGADILEPGLSVAATAADLGLVAEDDIDALQAGLYGFLFSLTPGSPTLLANGLSAADIFVSGADGSFSVYVTAGQIGLLETDNLDAFAATPEAGSAGLFALAAGSLWATGRRRVRAAAR